jgi:hypothetical protein
LERSESDVYSESTEDQLLSQDRSRQHILASDVAHCANIATKQFSQQYHGIAFGVPVDLLSAQYNPYPRQSGMDFWSSRNPTNDAPQQYHGTALGMPRDILPAQNGGNSRQSGLGFHPSNNSTNDIPQQYHGTALGVPTNLSSIQYGAGSYHSGAVHRPSDNIMRIAPILSDMVYGRDEHSSLMYPKSTETDIGRSK